MSKRIPLTLACGDYEITRALKEGTVQPDGIELTVLTEMDSTTRHWRFIHNRDFDMAETSASSYLAARSLGEPVTAIPVFLHRRFRHGFIFINTQKGIKKPTDLIGRKIGLKGYPGDRRPVAARHPRTRIRRAAHLGRIFHRTRRGGRIQPAEGPQADAASDDKTVEDMLCDRRARRRAASPT